MPFLNSVRFSINEDSNSTGPWGCGEDKGWGTCGRGKGKDRVGRRRGEGEPELCKVHWVSYSGVSVD